MAVSTIKNEPKPKELKMSELQKFLKGRSLQ